MPLRLRAFVANKYLRRMSKRKIIIIGSGIAALASAVRLAVQGFHVVVYEKNNYPGGKLSAFEKNGFHFDAGPSLFTQPENIEELFHLAGENISEYFQYKKVPVACKYFYEDGTIINAFTDAEKFAEELHNKTGESPEAVKKYLQQSSSLYNNIGKIFLEHSLHKKRTLLKAPLLKAILSAKRKYIFQPMHRMNAASFAKPHTVQLFNRYATYNGSNPYKAPAMLCMIPHLEYNEGIYYPKGGMISITNAVYQLALKKGVEFYFSSEVQRIIYSEGRIKGVVINNENILADAVISNMDVYFTYKQLLNDSLAAEKILRQERSSSALVFYWGIAKTFSQLELHNIFFTADYKTEFDCLFRHKKLFSDPTVYINITSKMEPGLQAPAAKENWFVMINAPANTGQDWQALQQQAKQYIIQKLNRMLQTDIAPLIETEAVLNPAIIEQNTASYMGSLYGTSSNSKMAAFLRHPNFSKEISCLYFAGGSVHPGGGIPLCLKSAAITSGLIEQDFAKRNLH